MWDWGLPVASVRGAVEIKAPSPWGRVLGASNEGSNPTRWPLVMFLISYFLTCKCLYMEWWKKPASRTIKWACSALFQHLESMCIFFFSWEAIFILWLKSLFMYLLFIKCVSFWLASEYYLFSQLIFYKAFYTLQAKKGQFTTYLWLLRAIWCGSLRTRIWFMKPTLWFQNVDHVRASALCTC